MLAGSVLSVWTKVEEVLTHDGNKRGQDSKMQASGYKVTLRETFVGGGVIKSKNNDSMIFVVIQLVILPDFLSLSIYPESKSS